MSRLEDCASLKASQDWSRRQWLSWGMGASTLLVPGTRAIAQAGDAKMAAKKAAKKAGSPAGEPGAAAPTKILILGDSMIAGAFGLFMQRALVRRMGAQVERKGKSSSGLARPDFYDWMDIGPPLAQGFAPDATIVMFGGNDCQSLRKGTDKDAGWIPWGRPKWEEEYRQRVRAFCDRVAPVGTRLFWIGMPVMGHERLHAKVKWINEVYREEMNQRAQSEFVDIWRVLANRRGEYTDKVKSKGEMIKVRAGDGIHLTVKGAHHLVANVAPQIAASLGETLSAPKPPGKRRRSRRG